MYHLFEVAGIELEYMIVDRNSLHILPIADKIILPRSENKSDVLNGEVDWSNELVSHVIEIKTHEPTNNLHGWHKVFHRNIIEINDELESYHASLLPTGAHPLMDPHKETVIWPHEYNEIYALYDRIFGCQGHGWSNVQSMHINLPFAGDEEFARLHAAIRVLLPFIPSLCASTPILDGRTTGFSDTRLEYYRNNQAKIPIIAGKIIPEQAFTRESYFEQVFDPIIREIKPYDDDGILEFNFLNSRGAISRFDRGAIEIRLIDLQEAPVADLAIAEFFIQLLKSLVEEKWSDLEYQKSLHQDDLYKVLLEGIKKGDGMELTFQPLLKAFGIQQSNLKASKFWDILMDQIELHPDHQRAIEHILKNGNLSTRILKKTGTEFDKQNLISVYKQLQNCLSLNELF